MAFAILERASGLELSSKTTVPRYSKLVTVPIFCPFTLTSLWMPLALFVISCGLFGTDLHHVPWAALVETFLGLLALAFPQLEHLRHWQTAD